MNWILVDESGNFIKDISATGFSAHEILNTKLRRRTPCAEFFVTDAQAGWSTEEYVSRGNILTFVANDLNTIAGEGAHIRIKNNSTGEEFKATIKENWATANDNGGYDIKYVLDISTLQIGEYSIGFSTDF
jgi:hypothetical protein